MAATPAGSATAVQPIVRQLPPGQPFTFWQHHLEYRTAEGPSFLNITEEVRQVVQASGISWGQVTVFSNHTTAAIRLQEDEPLLIEDLKDLLRRIAPREHNYRHNDFEVRTVNMHPNESPNGHSHCQHLLLSTSETIPLVDGDLQLGTWQSIFLVELDGGRERRVTVNILGIPRGD